MARKKTTDNGAAIGFEEKLWLTEYVTPLFDNAEANYEEFHSLTVTRDVLLPKLLSGEVRPSISNRLSGKE